MTWFWWLIPCTYSTHAVLCVRLKSWQNVNEYAISSDICHMSQSIAMDYVFKQEWHSYIHTESHRPQLAMICSWYCIWTLNTRHGWQKHFQFHLGVYTIQYNVLFSCNSKTLLLWNIFFMRFVYILALIFRFYFGPDISLYFGPEIWLNFGPAIWLYFCP